MSTNVAATSFTWYNWIGSREASSPLLPVIKKVVKIHAGPLLTGLLIYCGGLAPVSAL